MYFIRRLQFAALAFAACVIPTAVSAATVVTQTYSGSFPATIMGTLANQDTVLEEMITLPSASDLTVFTTSYPTGGFEPNLVLFNSAGNFVAVSGTQGGAPLNPGDLDAYLAVSGLTAGQYTIALTDWELNQSITATNLSDGFTSNYGNGVTFVDQNGAVRTGAYSLTAELSSTSATPEPASLLLVSPLLIAAGFYSRKRSLSSK